MTDRPIMRAAISGWGTAAPKYRLTNAELAKRVDTNDEWIVERTGIRERRFGCPDETTATLAIEAGTAAIKKANLTPSDINMLIVATTTPEQPIPHTGAFVGEGIGLHCGSFDLSAGCAGFVYALVVASGLITSGAARHVLVVGSETLSRIIDPLDRTTTVLFGDGAGAAVLSASPERSDGEPGPGLVSFDLGCDGSAAGLLEIPAGGSRLPASVETVNARQHFLKMEGKEVFRRAVRVVVESAEIAIKRAGITANDVDWFIPHQANIRIIDAACTRLGIPTERAVVNIERFGNTSAGSVPLAMAEAAEDGRLSDGDLILLSGFGAGMTWASVVLKWGQP